ncbi:hypothetical protein STEG23_007542, partial [Scotinomys teguina]
MCRLSWFLDPGGWSKATAVGLYFIFPGICTLSLQKDGPTFRIHSVNLCLLLVGKIFFNDFVKYVFCAFELVFFSFYSYYWKWSYRFPLFSLVYLVSLGSNFPSSAFCKAGFVDRLGLFMVSQISWTFCVMTFLDLVFSLTDKSISSI